ncbi:ABC transporter permease [Occultella kanbiaonis]|uniref:ABC transporter permease n=1 Tax=Occultella kanbiaonis TaxID=2675754 RepID=UPI0013D182CE|nr:ABC transporter permease [Occultella kanbiaonis]
MRVVGAIAGVELRRFLRDRSNLFFVFVFPLILVVLIGSQFGAASSSGRVVISGSDSSLRAALVAELEEAAVTVSYADADAASEQIARGRVDLGLELTDEAAAAFDADEDLTVVVTSSSSGGAIATRQQVDRALNALQLRLRQEAALVGAGADPAAVDEALEDAEAQVVAPTVTVTNTSSISEAFAGASGFTVGASAQVLLFVFLNSLAGSATMIQARKYRVVARTLAAPVATVQVIGGEALGRWVIAMVQGLYIMLGTALLFGVEWGNLALSTLILALFAAVAAGAAMVVGSALDNDSAASGLGVGLGLVLAALGGCMLPLELFPDTLQTVALFTPHAWAYQAFAEVTRRGGTFADIAGDLAVLLAFAVVLMALGSVLLRRSLARAI